MNRSLVVSAMLLVAGPAAFAGERSKCPSSSFQGMSLSERNLALYDAFWENIENHHYDRQMLTRSDVRALREQGRKQAVAATHPANLYGQIFSDITRQLPESRVSAEYPAPHRRFSKSPEEQNRLADLLFSSPGFEETTMRRGARDIRVVTEVANDSPAEEAGIRPGWRIVHARSNLDATHGTLRFAGEFVPLDSSAALAWERGELATDIPDPAKVLKINYAHRLLPARRPIERRMLAKGVSYLRFDGFGDDVFMRPVFEAMKEAGPSGLIIDLRWNEGGSTPQAQKIAGVLLGDDVLFGYHHGRAGMEKLETTKPARKFDGPLVVLIGPASGDSSEMLAAAVQDHRRGKLVGRATNGSLLTSSVYPLPDGGAMTVPTADFRSSKQKRLEGVGVAPDFRVLPTLEDVRAGRDVTLERALRILAYTAGGGGSDTAPSPRHRRGEMFPPI